MLIQYELALETSDWGEANFNPMVRAWGLKKDRKAKCKSCLNYKEGQCVYRCPFSHSTDYRACLRYKSKRRNQ